MGNTLKKIIEEHGVKVLKFPDFVCRSMEDAGASAQDIYTVMLILKCCPSVADTLATGAISAVDANTLLRNVVLKTGLHACVVRKVLGNLFRACGIEHSWGLHICSIGSYTGRFVSRKTYPEAAEEAAVSDLVAQLGRSDTDSAAFSDLHNMAMNGNVQAAYALGKYYKAMDDEHGGDDGKTYFAQALEMGYAPAGAALADYELRRKHKFMWRIAARFRNPTALSGKDGREWAPLGEQLLEYRKQNIGRIQSTLITQILVLILSVLWVSILPGGSLSGIALLLQLAGLVWTIGCRVRNSYHSVRSACYLVMASWILLTLTAL